jgi:hypothetical protein
VEVEWSVRALKRALLVFSVWNDLLFDDLLMMNAGVELLLLKTQRSLLECLRAYRLACFESKSSAFWRIRMRRLQLSSHTVA